MSEKSNLKYLQGYPDQILSQVETLIQQQRLGEILLKRYPEPHNIKSAKALYDYTMTLKNQYMKKSGSLSKVVYDSKINTIKHALGTHTYISRTHGGKLKASNEIHIATVFKTAPEAFLRMIVVHELAHFREKEHNKAFYQLCRYMEPDYHQLELDMRLYLTFLDSGEKLYP